MSREQEVLEQLKQIIDPDLGRDIVSLGFIKELQIDADGNVSFKVELTTPACPVKDQFKRHSEDVVNELPWVKSVSVTMTAAKRQSGFAKVGPGLQNVRHILAVSSCKGGVGKSTVAVNLAFTLAAQGAQVGIFDADVYGPSLPTMVRVVDFDGLYQQANLILPVESRGLKLMSFGWASQAAGGGPAIMRGPMVSQVINQLVTGTNWGNLDYLIIDMPPGTGDIQLTLCQLIPMTAALIVTTPQEISFVDVVKGIQMFDKLKVPTIGVVENMSYFICDQCDKRHNIFGEGAMRRLSEQFGIHNAIEIPLVGDIARQADEGTPIVVADPEGPVAAVYTELGEAMVREIAKVTHGGIARPEVTFETGKGIVCKLGDDTRTIPAADLRGACRCAHCVNEFTGEQQLDPATIPADIEPKQIEPMGNYAVSIGWSDGHDSIYPYEALLTFGKHECHCGK